MNNFTSKTIELGKVKNRIVTAEFSDAHISNYGGIMMLKEIDEKLGLTKRLAEVIEDARQKGKVVHENLTMLRQRVYALIMGEEDVNDHKFLRHDLALQTALDTDETLASPSSLCRFENRITKQMIALMSKVMVDIFIESFSKPPKELILDFDATDDLTHGEQECSAYHGYYRHDCFLPLHVYAGDKLVTTYLRPGNLDGAHNSAALFYLLEKRFREVWPDVKIKFRADCGFQRNRIIKLIEKTEKTTYLIGLGGNKVLMELVKEPLEKLVEEYNKTRQDQKRYITVKYKAESWDRDRRVIAKLEVNHHGTNVRFVCTNDERGCPKEVYGEEYCGRGRMENCIKESQLYLFSDRTSCSDFVANQFRLMLSSCAYILATELRRVYLKGTELAKATVETIRKKILRIGAIIKRNTRRVEFLLSSNYPTQELFYEVVRRIQRK